MKNSYSDVFVPRVWVHESEFPNIGLEEFQDNIFDMSVTSSGVEDKEKRINEYEDIQVKFNLGNNIVTLVQHQRYEVGKWLNEETKIFNETDLVPKYSYSLMIRDTMTGEKVYYKIELDRVEKVISESTNNDDLVDNPLIDPETTKTVVVGTIEPTDNPFDIDFENSTIEYIKKYD